MALGFLKRLGQSLLGERASEPLQLVQQHLERDEAALAWQLALSEASSWNLWGVEGMATVAVAAASCSLWSEAKEVLQRVQNLSPSPEENSACAALLQRIHALEEQQLTGQGLLCGPLWSPSPPPSLELPETWKRWATALPQVAEYVGPVEVRWAPGAQRGLFTSRAVKAGEVLMVAQPIAYAARNGPQLVAELRRKCRVSQRARRRLECLADGGARGSTMSPEEVTKELFLRPDDKPPEDLTLEASPEGDLKLQEILNHNVFVVDHSGEAALYGLPSMLNHSCDVTALKLVLVFFEKAMIFIATRDLDEGEELCHRYFDVEGTVAQRRDESKKWDFICDCCRCHFEATKLPQSSVAHAVDAAVTLFQEELRYDMRALSQEEGKAEVEQKRWPLLQRLLSAVDSVEEAVQCAGWSEKELAWTLALVQKLSNAALWCLLTHRSTRASSCDGAPKDPLALRCKVLGRLELALRHSEAFGFDHLQNLHLRWSALEEVRVSILARAAMDLQPEVVEPMVGPVVGRVAAPWSRVPGEQFFTKIRELGLRNFLQQEGGLVQVKDFLPEALAEEMLEMLKTLPQEEWLLSENQSSVDADHRFWRYEGSKLNQVKTIMQDLDPSLHPRLQGSSLDSNDWAAPQGWLR